MVWLKTGNSPSELQGLAKAVVECQDVFGPALVKTLKGLDFPCGWELVNKTLDSLDRTKARDLTRILLADKLCQLKELLERREEREQVIECLGYLPSRETVEILLKLLNHKDDNIQLIAAGALKNHTPRLVVPALMEALLEGRASPARAGEVLLAMGYLGQEALLEAYHGASFQLKAQILELLTMGENPKCRPLVEDALKAEHSLLKRRGLEAAAFFSFVELWPEIVMGLAEKEWIIRAKTLEVLAKLEVKEALEFVEPFMNDENTWVANGARKCLEVLRHIPDRIDGEENV